jgi:5-methylcytosine-specific restriction endonuclease McrA
VTRPYDKAMHRRASRAIRGLPCWVCGRPSSELDHVVALADGGAAFVPQNVAPSCRACNRRRGLEVARRHVRGLGVHSRRW